MKKKQNKTNKKQSKKKTTNIMKIKNNNDNKQFNIIKSNLIKSNKNIYIKIRIITESN